MSEWIAHSGNKQPPDTKGRKVIYRVQIGKLYPRLAACHPYWADDLNWRTTAPKTPKLGKIVDYRILQETRKE